MGNETYKDKVKQIKALVTELNGYCHAYYNLNQSVVSDEAYDCLLEKLTKLEAETGCILSNSPTRRVGFEPIDKLAKVTHETPLLSLDKTKELHAISGFIGGHDAMLMLKLDGLTIKLIYEDGRLISASTRGDGITGSDVTHNIKAFQNVPLEIGYRKRLVIIGEGLIHTDDFETLKKIAGESGTLYKSARNLASGSAKLLNPEECRDRCLYFYPFSVQSGLDEEAGDADSKAAKLTKLTDYGFDKCYFYTIAGGSSAEYIGEKMMKLKSLAERKHIPIDGIVVAYDSISFSQSRGKTEKFYKDGLAFKFGDDIYQTIVTGIDWRISKNGVITPVAVFEPVEIDGGTITRATLFNVSNLERLKINIGCRILISRKNMIIPHVEENLDMNKGCAAIPDECPVCGAVTEIRASEEKGSKAKILCCTGDNCSEKVLQGIVYFANKEVMDIDGLAESTAERLINAGIIKNPVDLYTNIERNRDFITGMEGFGASSYNRLSTAIRNSRDVTLDKFIRALHIQTIGKTASKRIHAFFGGNAKEFEQAVYERFEFTNIEGIGPVMNFHIYNWFTKTNEKGYVADHAENWLYYYDLKEQLRFTGNPAESAAAIADNPFTQKNFVITGTLSRFSRNEAAQKIESLGGYAKDTVSSKTDYVIVGEAPGNKLNQAKARSIPLLTEADFLEMLRNIA